MKIFDAKDTNLHSLINIDKNAFEDKLVNVVVRGVLGDEITNRSPTTNNNA